MGAVMKVICQVERCRFNDNKSCTHRSGVVAIGEGKQCCFYMRRDSKEVDKPSNSVK